MVDPNLYISPAWINKLGLREAWPITSRPPERASPMYQRVVSHKCLLIKSDAIG